MTPFAVLSLPAQVALSWLVTVGGRPWSSDLPSLTGLERDGLAHHDTDDDTWRPTDRGRACWHARYDAPDPYPIPDDATSRRDPFYAPPKETA